MSYWQILFRWTQQHPMHDVALTVFLGPLRCNVSLVRAAKARVFNIHNNWLFLHCLSELAMQQARFFLPSLRSFTRPQTRLYLTLILSRNLQQSNRCEIVFIIQKKSTANEMREKATETEAANRGLDKNTRLWQMSETQIGLKLCKWSSSTTCENKSFERNILRSLLHPAIT